MRFIQCIQATKRQLLTSSSNSGSADVRVFITSDSQEVIAMLQKQDFGSWKVVVSEGQPSHVSSAIQSTEEVQKTNEKAVTKAGIIKAYSDFFVLGEDI